MDAHRVVVRPVRLMERDAQLGCMKLRGVGYAWRCGCGERGPIVSDYATARAGGMEHRRVTPIADDPHG